MVHSGVAIVHANVAAAAPKVLANARKPSPAKRVHGGRAVQVMAAGAQAVQALSHRGPAAQVPEAHRHSWRARSI